MREESKKIKTTFVGIGWDPPSHLGFEKRREKVGPHLGLMDTL